MMRRINRLFLWIHRWSGILFALIFIVVGLSGTLLTFRYEIQQFFYPDELSTGLTADDRPNFVAVARSLSTQIPGAEPSFLQMNPARPDFPMRAVVTTPDGGSQVHYAHPLTGALVNRDIDETFWRWMRDLHIFLLSGIPGLLVVFASGWVLILCSLLGTWLWAPRLRKPKVALGVRWRASARKFMLDLHNVTGVYLLIPMLFLALTGVTLILARISPTVLPQPDVGLADERSIASQDFAHLQAALATMYETGGKLYVQQIRMPTDAQPWFTFSLRDAAVGYRTAHIDQSGNDVIVMHDERDLAVWHELKGELGVAIHEGYIWGSFGRWLVFICGLTLTIGSITGVWLWFIARRQRHRLPDNKPISIRLSPGSSR